MSGGEQKGRSSRPDHNYPLKQLWKDWRSKGPLDHFVIAITVVAFLLTAASVVLQFFSHPQQFAAIVFALQNLLLLVLSAGYALRYFYFQEGYRHRLVLERRERRQESKYWRQLLQTVFRQFHAMNHIKRDLMNSQQFDVRPLNPRDTVAQLVEYCESIKKVFDALFERQDLRFHVSIKALVSVDTPPAVVTIARDHDTLVAHGHMIDDERPHFVSRNTDFKHLLDKSERRYACDDLAARNHGSTYDNSSIHWQRRYNATLVVPIRKNDVSTNGTFELVGYIAVNCLPRHEMNVFCDSKGYPREEFVHFLLGYADSTYGILKRGRIAGHGARVPQSNNYIIDNDNVQFLMDLNSEFVRQCKTMNVSAHHGI